MSLCNDYIYSIIIDCYKKKDIYMMVGWCKGTEWQPTSLNSSHDCTVLHRVSDIITLLNMT